MSNAWQPSGPRRARPQQQRQHPFHSLAFAVVAATGALAAAMPAAAQDANLARNLAATCANCHGTNGQARGEMKPLAGMPAETMVTMLSAFRSGALPATIMHQVVKGYTEEQVRLIAGYFAAQKPAAK